MSFTKLSSAVSRITGINVEILENIKTMPEELGYRGITD